MNELTTTAHPWGPDWAITAIEHRTCDQHGGYESHRMQHRHPLNKPWWTNCPRCNADWQREADEHDAAILGGLTAKQRAIAARLQALNVPPRLSDATLWNFQHGMPIQRRVWDRVRNYASEFEVAIATGRCLVFHGPKGTGKSHLAIGLLKHIAEKGGTGYYTTVMDMLGRIKATYHRSAEETETQVVEFLTSVDMLVIDEVGRQLDSNYEIAQFWRLIDLRYRNQKAMVLISNMAKAALEEHLGDAIWDRLRENGGACLLFNWGSYRGTKKPEVDDEQ